MATASVTLSPATVTPAARVGTNKSSQKRIKVKYISGLNSFEGLKAHNNVASLGLPLSTEQSFANIVSSLRTTSSSQGKGGALSSTCNAAVEIFKIASIIPALVLVGVAVGFVLLRIEAAVEEAD